ncbi:hypothetical protein HS088_TW02G00787 [Tripterygium wilfordii]|uniref:Uncharacterized protein n=1 Tax=Tripterygium wilfordii TaxID=458696 RepID=A0A7J7DZR1_TRIWF|nr:hypothetical protein HS088_TW02G00787 [Tripterygium wilfordii]
MPSLVLLLPKFMWQEEETLGVSLWAVRWKTIGRFKIHDMLESCFAENQEESPDNFSCSSEDEHARRANGEKNMWSSEKKNPHEKNKHFGICIECDQILPLMNSGLKKTAQINSMSTGINSMSSEITLQVSNYVKDICISNFPYSQTITSLRIYILYASAQVERKLSTESLSESNDSVEPPNQLPESKSQMDNKMRLSTSLGSDATTRMYAYKNSPRQGKLGRDHFGENLQELEGL